MTHPVIALQERIKASPTLRGVLDWPEWSAAIERIAADASELRRIRAELLGRDRIEVVK